MSRTDGGSASLPGVERLMIAELLSHLQVKAQIVQFHKEMESSHPHVIAIRNRTRP